MINFKILRLQFLIDVQRVRNFYNSIVQIIFYVTASYIMVNKIKFLKIYRENLSGAILPQMRRIKTKSRRERKKTIFRFAVANL